jgi:hypothetical protein
MNAMAAVRCSGAACPPSRCAGIVVGRHSAIASLDGFESPAGGVQPATEVDLASRNPAPTSQPKQLRGSSFAVAARGSVRPRPSARSREPWSSPSPRSTALDATPRPRTSRTCRSAPPLTSAARNRFDRRGFSLHPERAPHRSCRSTSPGGMFVAVKPRQHRIAAELQHRATPCLYASPNRAEKHSFIASTRCSAPSLPARTRRSDNRVNPEISANTPRPGDCPPGSPAPAPSVRPAGQGRNGPTWRYRISSPNRAAPINKTGALPSGRPKPV